MEYLWEQAEDTESEMEQNNPYVRKRECCVVERVADDMIQQNDPQELH